MVSFFIDFLKFLVHHQSEINDRSEYFVLEPLSMSNASEQHTVCSRIASFKLQREKKVLTFCVHIGGNPSCCRGSKLFLLC